MRTSLLPCLALALGFASLGACSPYERRDGEFFAGTVDAARFPAAYLGEDAVPGRAGSGRFLPISAKAAGRDVVYYALPFPAHQARADDPLLLSSATTGEGALPRAYTFAPGCAAPQGYAFDQQRESYRQDQQGSVFVALPSAAGYVPLVAEYAVNAAGLPCQAIKSEEALLAREDLRASATGRYLAWPILDPAADVLDPGEAEAERLPPSSALGPQRWGWYSRYLLAYLDGGAVPTQPAAGGARMKAQALYYPRTAPAMNGMTRPGAPGEGLDVLDAARGDAGYSPVCRVLSYEPKDPRQPATDAAQIDPMTVKDEKTLLYCLQLR